MTVGLREALFGGFAELGHGLVEDIGSYPVILADYLRAVERYFKSVRAGRVAGCRDEHAGRAVFIFGIYSHVVLDFDIVPLAYGALRLNGFGHTGYPLPQIELMRALVEQHAAALAAPGRAPSAGIIICLRAIPVGDEPVEAVQPAVFAALHDFAQLDIHGIRPLIEHQREHFVALRCDFVHFANLLCINARGLFAEHMDAVSQTVFDYRRVRIVRRCDYNSVDLARVNEGLGGVKAFYLAASVMAFLLGALKLCGIDIGYRGENHLGDETVEIIAEVSGTHVANADYAVAQGLDSCDNFLYAVHCGGK